MKRKVIFLQAGIEVGCAMANVLTASTVGEYGIANVDGRKKAITKRNGSFVVELY